MFVLFDYVHLIKSIRNNLVTKDLLINANATVDNDKQFACWDDIKTAYNMDKHSTLRQRNLPKLTDKRIYEDMIPKMKVKYATQVLSHTMACFINMVVTLNQDKYK